MSELIFQNAEQAADNASPEELFTACRDRIDELDGELNCFLHEWDSFDESRALSAKFDAPANGRPQLSGVPVALKDILTVGGAPTTCASRILEGWEPPYTATAVRNLLGAGNYALGKNNMDEFAMGSSGENSARGPTRNPHDTDRVPGGSSSGSAAAVASGQAYVALGSDTGGSVRQPAALSGVVGFKPSYGYISRYGLIAYASSLDQVGIFSRSVRDAALAMNTISTPDPKDSTCQAEGETDFVAALENGAVEKVGYIESLADPELIGEEVLENFRRSVDVFEQAGIEVEPVSFPELQEVALPAYYVISCAEASSNLARYDGIRYGPSVDADDLEELYIQNRSRGFGDEVKRRILLGTWVLSVGYYDAYYQQARAVRGLIAERFEEKFTEVDYLLSPTAPELAFPLGHKVEDPVKMYVSDICTVGANLAGLPGISVPNGFGEADGSELPTGLQIIGPRFGDAGVLALARRYEKESGDGFRPPEL